MKITEDMTGRPLGKYELHDRLGRGGMAEVYKAYHASLDRFVALKILHPFLSDDLEFKDRFEREARHIAKLRHNHIVQVYDFDFEPGPDLYFMVMEYVDGPTLRTMLLQQEAKKELISPEEVIRISRDLASALAYAHDQNMIHRDIKPGNIMLDADGRVVLTDFGIAKIVSGKQITASGTMIGTPAYMAPEQGLGRPGDHRADIYSLGVVMYQLASGVPPYEADTPIALVLKHVNDPLPPLSTYNANLPEGLERIIYKSLAKDPEERFGSASELVENLNDLPSAARIAVPTGATELVDQTPIDLAAPRSTIVTEAPTPTGRPALFRVSPYVGLAAALVLIAALAAAILLLPGLSGADSGSATPQPATGEATTTPGAAVQSDEVAEVVSPAANTPAAPLDAEGTAIVATLDTIRAERATQVALATQPSNGTDLPPLVSAACDFDYSLISVSPEQTLVRQNSTVEQQIVLLNSGDCDWESGAKFEFLDGVGLNAPLELVVEERIETGEQATLEVEFLLPPFSFNDPVAQSTWRLTTADGEQIGRLFTFNFQIEPPTVTPTASPAPSS